MDDELYASIFPKYSLSITLERAQEMYVEVSTLNFIVACEFKLAIGDR